MRRIGFALMVAALLLAGCGRGPTGTTSGGDLNIIQATRNAMNATPLPTSLPTAPVLPDPTDPLTVVLGGEFANGGYWTWEDIANLLGVYAQYDAYETVSMDGQSYTGVPLSYLLDYARINPFAQGMAVLDREEQRHDYLAEDVADCETCLLVRAPDETITLVMPSFTPPVVTHVVRIEVR